MWQQTVQIANRSCDRVENLALGLDSLASGWTLTNGNTGAFPNKGFGALDSLGKVTVTLQFDRVGTPALTYNPFVTGTVIAATAKTASAACQAPQLATK